jgi:hypothetical protein
LPSTEMRDRFNTAVALQWLDGYTYRQRDWWQGFMKTPFRWTRLPSCTYQV